MLLFANMSFSCKHGGDGVSTLMVIAIYHWHLQKYVRFIMYCGNALLLFTCKLNCLKTF